MKKTRGITRKMFADSIKQRWEDIARLLYMHGRLRFRPVWRYPTPRRFILSQKGGGEININNQVFQYNEDINSKNGVIAIHGSFAGGYECFAIQFDIHSSNNQKYAYLMTLGGHKECSIDGNAKSTNIVKAAVELARQHGAQWIELTDNSKICKGVALHSVSLADYYFMTRSKTWYETILPFKPDRPDIIEKARNRVINMSWEDILNDIRMNDINIFKQITDVIPISSVKVNITAPGSAMSVLQDIPKEKRCLFLYTFNDYLLEAFNIRSLDGSTWWLPLTPIADRPAYVTHQYINVLKNGYE
jgi:hypothetical protein